MKLFQVCHNSIDFFANNAKAFDFFTYFDGVVWHWTRKTHAVDYIFVEMKRHMILAFDLHQKNNKKGPIHTRHFYAQYCDKKIFFNKFYFHCVNWKYSFMSMDTWVCIENNNILKCHYNILKKKLSFFWSIFLSQYCVQKYVWRGPLGVYPVVNFTYILRNTFFHFFHQNITNTNCKGPFK